MTVNDGWQSRNTAEILSVLGSDPQRGLDSGRVAANRRRWGRNDLWYTGSPFMFFKNESSFSLIGYAFMAVAAFSAAAFGKCADYVWVGIAIAVGIIISGLFYIAAGMICRVHSGKWVPMCTVVRDGEIKRVRAVSLVLGDIVLLRPGERVCSDVKLISSNELSVIDSPITKRKGIVRKSAVGTALATEGQHLPEDYVYTGAEVVEGIGRAVVCAVGAGTLQGERGKYRLASPKEPVSLTVVRKRGVSVGTVAMIFSFAAIAIGVFSPIAAADFIGLFLIFLSFAVSACGELVPSLYSLYYYSALKNADNDGFCMRDAAGVDYTVNCDGIAVENTALMKSGKTELYSVWTYGVDTDTGKFSGSELLSLMLTGTCHGNGKYGKEVLLAVEEYITEKKDTTKFFATAQNTRPVLEHRIEGASHYSLYVSGGQEYFSVTGSIEDVISKCTKLRVGGKDVPLNNTNMAEILRSASDSLKKASSIIAFAARKSPYNNMVRLSVLTSELTFYGFIAMNTPPHPELPSYLAYLRDEKVPFMMFTDGSGEDMNFARKLGIINSRSGLVSAGDPSNVVLEIFSENSDGGVVYSVSGSQVSSCLEAVRKSGKRIIYVGSGDHVKSTDFAVVRGEAISGTGAFITTDAGSEVSTVIKAVQTVRTILGRLSKAYVYLSVSSVLRAVYSATVLFGMPYVYPSVILTWGLIIDAIVAGIIIGIKKK